MALQTFALSGSFIAGAHRTSSIRYRVPIMLPILLAIPFIRYVPLAIPAAPLISYAYFTLGNAWKYWYLQQDPNRHIHHPDFKDPNTRPQRHVIRGLLLAPSTFLIGGILGLIIQGLHLATRETSGRIATIIILLLLLLSILRGSYRNRSTHPQGFAQTLGLDTPRTHMNTPSPSQHATDTHPLSFTMRAHLARNVRSKASHLPGNSRSLWSPHRCLSGESCLRGLQQWRGQWRAPTQKNPG